MTNEVKIFVYGSDVENMKIAGGLIYWNGLKYIYGYIRENKTSVNMQLLENPPGRSPSKELVGLSNWYKALDISDKENLHEIIKLTSKHSVFGILCVIDGVREIENTFNKGELVLEFHKNGEIVRLNDPNEEYLHDIFNSD